MVSIDNAVLVVVDVQGKLATLMHDSESLCKQIETLVLSCKELDIPVLPVEQLPHKLGETVSQIRQHLDLPIIAKSTFSAAGDFAFVDHLQRLDRKQVLLVGIETHVCVYQTALDLISQGYDVHLVQDATSSRNVENKTLAISNLRSIGANITSVEMLLFELMKTAEHAKFREIQKLIK